MFNQTDLKTAKEKISGWAGISGNVPPSLFYQASAQKLESYCRDLIESCAPGGGFCLSPGAIINQANPENVAAFLACGKKYGTCGKQGAKP